MTLKEINANLNKYAKNKKISLKIVQTNWEGKIIDLIQKAKGKFDGIIINPAAYTHYSIAIYDAIIAVGIPTMEVHLSNIYKRKNFAENQWLPRLAWGRFADWDGKVIF